MPRRSTPIAQSVVALILAVCLAPPSASALEMTARGVTIGKELTTGSALKVAGKLFKLDAQGDEPILLHISTRSGYAPAAMIVVDAIRAVKSDVYAVIHSEAFGVGAVIAAFCKRRYAFPHASVLLTRLEYDSEKVMKDKPPLPQQAADAYVDRIWAELAKQLDIRKSSLAERAASGWFLTAGEAKREGIVTDVVTDVKWVNLVTETIEVKRTRVKKKKSPTYKVNGK